MTDKPLAETSVIVKVPLAGVKKGLAMVKGVLTKFNNDSGRLMKLGALGFVAAGTALMKMGSDANEAASKLDAVFGDAAGSIREFADEYASHVGRSRQEVRSFTTDMGALTKGMGFAAGDAGKLGQQITAMAYDIGSFHNVSDVDAFNALRSAISGEAEPMKKFGVVLNDTAMNAQLLKMGLTGGTQAASEQQKVLARVAIMQEKLNQQGATGDAEKTADGVANSWKRLQGEAMDLGAEIGTALLPLAKELIEVFRMAVGSLGLLSSGFTETGAAGKGVLGTLVEWIKAVVLALSNWDLGAKLIGVSFMESLTNMWGRVKWFGEQTKILLSWLFDNWKTVALDIVNIYITSFKNMFTNIVEIVKNLPGLISGSVKWGDVWKPMLDGFEAKTKEMPKFTEFVAADFKQQYKEIDNEWAKRMKQINTPKDKPELSKDVNSLSETIDAKQFDDPTKKKKNKDEGTFTDIASIFKNAQEAIGKAKDDKRAAEALTAAKETAAAATRTANAVEKTANKAKEVVPT